jgi:hypothetical protein
MLKSGPSDQTSDALCDCNEFMTAQNTGPLYSAH